MVLRSCHVDAKVSRSSVQWNTVSAGGGGGLETKGAKCQIQKLR